MDYLGIIQLVLFIGVLVMFTKPMGLYLTQVLDYYQKPFLTPIIGPLECYLYKIMRIDPEVEHGWKEYATSLLIFSFVGTIFMYGVLRLQSTLPLNPENFGSVSATLSFNTSVSFATNTNWQNYGGESTLSYFSQMMALTFQNFVSAAVGISVAAALVRGIARASTKTIGNFWSDIIRINLYVLLPMCMIYAIFLVSQGMIQNFRPYDTAHLINPYVSELVKKDSDGREIKDSFGRVVKESREIETQRIVQGPMASQVAIKMLGTNGGGFTNANAAHPFENPTPLSNFIQMLSIFLIPSGLTYFLGRMVQNQRHGWAVWTAMTLIFVIGFLVCWWAESNGNPRLYALGVDGLFGNLEGKEVRFGIFGSALFATVTTGASCGAVNSMHDSYTPLGGLIPLLNIQLGEVIFGGVGAGIYGILVFVILAVFLAGLMIGRTPEYLGKKIEAFDIKASVLFIIIPVLVILGLTAWACVSEWGFTAISNGGPHGFTQILYAYSSTTGNNGSAFAGLNGNTSMYNVTLGSAMLIGRFFTIIPVLALAGNLAQKKIAPISSGSFPAEGPTFILLLITTILIVGALTFFPALSLGPIVEHCLMYQSTVLF